MVPSDKREPSEDSFETMMERKNPSSKQMESSGGSSSSAAQAEGAQAEGVQAEGVQAESAQAEGAQAEEGAQAKGAQAEGAAGSSQGGGEELPTDVRQDMEGPSSGPHTEFKDPPNDLLQDLEESCAASHLEVAGSWGGEPAEREGASASSWGSQEEESEDEEEEEEDFRPPGAAAPEGQHGQPGEGAQGPMAEFLGLVRSLISLCFRMQDLQRQLRAAEEILLQALATGRLPIPTPFSGDRRDYPEFIALCQLILQSHPRTSADDDQRRVAYIVGHLSGMARDWAQRLIEQNQPLASDFPGFLEAMSEMFEYRHSVRVAEDTMFNLRQGDRPAIDYITEFRGLVPILGWADEVLQAHLCQGLREEIRHYLFRVPRPDSLDSLIVLILQIEEKLAERRAILRLPPSARPRNLTWIDTPAPERWMVSSWLPNEMHPTLDRNHLFLLLLVRINPYHSVAVRALVDSGASSNYMDEGFAQEHYVELYERTYPNPVQNLDGSLVGNEPVWLYTEPLVCIHQNHQESLEFDIVPSPNFSVILGIKWLQLHMPEMDWTRGRCTFHSPYCLANCFRPPPPCVALERHAVSLLPGLPPPYSDLADVFNPKEGEEASDQPSSDGSDELSESEPSELQQAGDSDQSETFYDCLSSAPWEPVGAGMQESSAMPAHGDEIGFDNDDDDDWDPWGMLNNTEDDIQMIPELFNQLHGAMWFTKLELQGTIVEEGLTITHVETVWAVAFGLDTSNRIYTPFTPGSSPIIRQRTMYYILSDLLGLFVLSYGQDVLVYSMSQEEHFRHVRQVLVRLRRNRIYCSLDRTQFHRHTVDFLGFVINPRGVRLNKSIIKTITGYPIPGSKKSLRHLIQFIFPYRHFIERFAILTEPLVRQLLTNRPFRWTEEEQEAFDGLRRAVRRAPLLHHPKPQHPFYLETGVVRSALHASLIQIEEQTGRRVCCAFYSRYLTPEENNESRLQLRILPIRAAFSVWCHYLENTEEPIMILLNTEDLASLNNDRLTVLLQGQWAAFFSKYNFDVMEEPECEDGRPLPPRQRLSSRSLAGAASCGRQGEERRACARARERGLRQQECLASLPIEQILADFLTHLGEAQIRSVLLHFFHGLLDWKNNVAVAALLVMLREAQPCPLPIMAIPSGTLMLVRHRSLRSLLAASLVSCPRAAAITRLITQVPPLAGAHTVPAHELAELFLGPGHWQCQALLPRATGTPRFSPDFWLLLCEIFGVRVTLAQGGHRGLPCPAQPHVLHVSSVESDEDVALRAALQDDLQNSRHSGLHDGLQDRSQGAQGASDVQRGSTRPIHFQLPSQARVLAFLRAHQRTLPSPESVNALMHFLRIIYGHVDPALEGAWLEEFLEDADTHDQHDH
ncbi:retrotransposon-like protein 1 [Suncus etruscus]|uniref:retrotransposon-like protein 1 n=1 Tax=Suncus etruscus TaxID=109475 RepID=UPI002110283A|nr:retrotransposon-like protein 1 [Suncus etruscus]